MSHFKIRNFKKTAKVDQNMCKMEISRTDKIHINMTKGQYI